ncbi:MAG TPA: hypothetical protein PKV98_18965, partial [Burkholderiaceae bacterium]|nr:hypothetical protein [Burkholderiaceae bacterium]
ISDPKTFSRAHLALVRGQAVSSGSGCEGNDDMVGVIYNAAIDWELVAAGQALRDFFVGRGAPDFTAGLGEAA